MATHHPHEALLVDYAAGSMHEPGSLVIASHLTLCPTCRDAVDDLESVGGSLLSTLEPTAVPDGALDTLLQSLAGLEPHVEPPPPLGDPRIPSPLRHYLSSESLDAVPWRGMLGGVKEHVLEVGPSPTRTFLLKMGAGKKLPRHTHRGVELTLILEGAYTDHIGEFRRGDFVALDSDTVHQPVITDEGDCVCLAVTDAPLRFTGPFARLMNPFLKQ